MNIVTSYTRASETRDAMLLADITPTSRANISLEGTPEEIDKMILFLSTQLHKTAPEIVSKQTRMELTAAMIPLHTAALAEAKDLLTQPV